MGVMVQNKVSPFYGPRCRSKRLITVSLSERWCN